MSLQRFSLYFLAVMASAVVAFPRLAPALSVASTSDLPAARAVTRPCARKMPPSVHRRTPEPPRLVASN